MVFFNVNLAMLSGTLFQASTSESRNDDSLCRVQTNGWKRPVELFYEALGHV